ncbi:MAG: hypothetical protein H7287_11085 [Thermoleophilia bacterium]|nr:hypothetical protein [Thermoleophilia bacterium]
MGSHANTVVIVAGALAVAAFIAAIACIAVVAWLVRGEQRAGAAANGGAGPVRSATFAYPYAQPQVLLPQPPTHHYVQAPMMTMPAPVQYVPVAPPHHQAPQQPVVVVQGGGLPAGSIVLSRAWPGVVEALEQQLRVEADPVDRVRAAIDLGGIGNVQSTRAVIGAVRDGVISPAAGAHAVEGSSFDAGVAVGVALADVDPRVRTFAGLVSQRLDRAAR